MMLDKKPKSLVVESKPMPIGLTVQARKKQSRKSSFSLYCVKGKLVKAKVGSLQLIFPDN